MDNITQQNQRKYNASVTDYAHSYKENAIKLSGSLESIYWMFKTF
jgi:hypothetical protein